MKFEDKYRTHIDVWKELAKAYTDLGNKLDELRRMIKVKVVKKKIKFKEGKSKGVEELIKMTNKNHTRKNCSGACTSMANEGTVLNTRSSETFKIQGLITTIQELRKIANQLDKEVKDNEEKYKVSGWGTKFQLNIINRSGDSDGWEFEDVK